MSNICGEHDICHIPEILKTILFIRLLLAEQKGSLAVLINPSKQIPQLEFRIVGFCGGRLDYRVWGKLISHSGVKPEPSHWSCFTRCASLLVAESQSTVVPLPC